MKKEPWLFRHWFGAYVIWRTWRVCRTTGAAFRTVLPSVHAELLRQGAVKR